MNRKFVGSSNTRTRENKNKNKKKHKLTSSTGFSRKRFACFDGLFCVWINEFLKKVEKELIPSKIFVCLINNFYNWKKKKNTWIKIEFEEVGFWWLCIKLFIIWSSDFFSLSRAADKPFFCSVNTFATCWN